MIVVLRHGERADNSPFEEDQKEVKVSFDPHLTELGLIQSEMCALNLKNMLLQINPNVKNIVYVSSPFLRCLQTASQVSKFLGFNAVEDKLFAQSQIGEMLRSSWFTEDVNSKLRVKTDEEIKNQIGLQIVEPFVEDKRLIEQVYPEDKLGDFYDRFRAAYKQQTYMQFNIFYSINLNSVIVETFMNNYNTDETALILVTHGFGVQVVLDQLNCFNFSDMVDYCSINIFDYREQSLPDKDYPNWPKVCIKQFHKHVIEADTEIYKRKQMVAKI